jgi:alpha-galactosidase
VRQRGPQRRGRLPDDGGGSRGGWPAGGVQICEWGDNRPWEWGKGIGHLWRTTGDITACFDCEVDHGDWSSWGVLRILDMQEGLRAHAGPGHWNDPT